MNEQTKQKINIWDIWWISDSQFDFYSTPKLRRPGIIVSVEKSEYKILSITSNQDNKWFYCPIKLFNNHEKKYSNVQMNKTYSVKKEFVLEHIRTCTDQEKDVLKNWNKFVHNQKTAKYLLALKEKELLIQQIKEFELRNPSDLITRKNFLSVKNECYKLSKDEKPIKFSLNEKIDSSQLNRKKTQNYLYLLFKKDYLDTYISGAQKTIFESLLFSDHSTNALHYKKIIENFTIEATAQKNTHTLEKVNMDNFHSVCLSFLDSSENENNFFWNEEPLYAYEELFFENLRSLELQTKREVLKKTVEKINYKLVKHLFSTFFLQLSGKYSVNDVPYSLHNATTITTFLQDTDIQHHKKNQTIFLTFLVAFQKFQTLEKNNETDSWVKRNAFKNWETENTTDKESFPKNPNLIINYLKKTQQYGWERLVKQHILYFIKEKKWD